MSAQSQSTIKTGSNADLAFAVVVLASYFATFSSVRQATLFDILLMIVLGTIYIVFGIYGYAYCVRSDLLLIRIGYFLIQLPLGGLIVSLGKGTGYNALLLIPLAGHAVVLLSEYWVYLANAGILMIYIISTGSYTSNWSEVWAELPTFLAGLIFIMVFTQSSVSEERARREVERLVGELQDANQRLRQYALQVEELAISKERNRLAREIHDGLGHSLTTIHMEIQAARAVMELHPERSRIMLEKAQSMTQEALADVRHSVSTLRDSPEENQPLSNLVTHLLGTCDMAGIISDVKILGAPRPLSAQAHLTMYRAAQECINNVCKHSSANHVWIRLDYLDVTHFRMLVQDDGVGADTLEDGFGLMGMKERINLLNGTLIIQTEKNQGFRLEICIPT